MKFISSVSVLGFLATISFVGCNKKGESITQEPTSENNILQTSNERKNEVTKISCQDIIKEKKDVNNKELSIDKKTNITLCNYMENKLNKGIKPVSAYSHNWDSTILFPEINNGNMDPVKFSAISKDGDFTESGKVVKNKGNFSVTLNYLFNIIKNDKIILAFGRFNEENVNKQSYYHVEYTGINKREKQSHLNRPMDFTDIHFVTEQGKIYKGNAQNNPIYEEEFQIPQNYMKENHVFASFVIPNTDELVFLKKLTTNSATNENEKKSVVSKSVYDTMKYNKLTNTYEVKSSNEQISTLFPMLSDEEIANVDHLEVLPNNQLALFHKSKESNTYNGFYLVSDKDIKNSNAKTTFVSHEENTEVNCEDKNNEGKCVFVKGGVSKRYDSGNVAAEVRKGIFVFVLPPQENVICIRLDKI